MADLLLKGGEVIDPSQNLRARLDVAVKDGAISRLAPNMSPKEAARVMDVSGKLVVPGLIDLHCHVYEGVTGSGISADLAGVRSGVTTLVDAGSAGCYTFGGLPLYVVPRAKARIFCMLAISRTKGYEPEITSPEDIDLEETIRVIQANKPLIQGVKVRAVGPAYVAMGIDVVRQAKRAANEGGVRLMVHIGETNEGVWPTMTRELLPLLEPGDILTHVFCGLPGGILDDKGRVFPELMEAQERGVFLDTAHGNQMMSFDVARRVLDQGVRPQGISTDMTLSGRRKSFLSMTEMLSKFLALGFSLEDVIRMATANAAKALGMEDTLGSLAVGRDADITVLQEATGSWLFHDSGGQTMKGTKALVPVVTIKGGEVFTPDWGPRPWGWLPMSASR